MRIALVGIALVAVGCGGSRSLPPNDAELVEQWLSSTCGVGEERKNLASQIAARGAEIEPLFIAAFDGGPSSKHRAALADAVERTWSRSQVQLAEPEVYRLNQAVPRLMSISLADQKRREMERHDTNYRAGALAALGLTKGPRGRQLLQTTAANQSSRFRFIASAVLGGDANNPNR